MLYVSDRLSKTRIEVSDSTTGKVRRVTMEMAKTWGTVEGLGANGCITTYRDVEDFLVRFSLRQRLVAPNVEYKFEYAYGLIYLNKCIVYGNELCDAIIPDFVDSVVDECFKDAVNLRSINILADLDSLSSSCFEGCVALECIHLPESLHFLGVRCFAGCSSLKSIDLPDNIFLLEDVCFQGCTSLESIGWSRYIHTLGDFCFSGCENLSEIQLPSTITNIGVCCFKGSGLQNSITVLPKGCK